MQADEVARYFEKSQIYLAEGCFQVNNSQEMFFYDYKMPRYIRSKSHVECELFTYNYLRPGNRGGGAVGCLPHQLLAWGSRPPTFMQMCSEYTYVVSNFY